MFFLTTGVLFSVLALAQAIITSPTDSTVWNSGDQVTVDWDPSTIPAEDDSPGKLVLGHPEGDSDNLDLDNPLAQDFPLSAGSVQFTVPDLDSASNYIVVLFAGDSDDGDASPQFSINSQPKLVKKAPQEMPDSDPSDPTTDSPDPSNPDPSEPTDSPDTPDTPDSTDPGAGPSPSSPAASGAPTSPAPAATTPARATTSAAAAATTTPKNATSPSSAPLSANSSSLNPSTTGSGSGSNGALSFAHAHHTGVISLSAAVAAMGLVFAF